MEMKECAFKKKIKNKKPRRLMSLRPYLSYYAFDHYQYTVGI